MEGPVSWTEPSYVFVLKEHRSPQFSTNEEIVIVEFMSVLLSTPYEGIFFKPNFVQKNLTKIKYTFNSWTIFCTLGNNTYNSKKSAGFPQQKSLGIEG